MRILVVEDNPANLKLVAFLLEEAGYSVLTATDAAVAIELAGTEVPDLVLMDVQLPGMDGLEATRRLKSGANPRHIPVVALTAFAMKGDEDRIRAAGCDGYIPKPIRYQSFLEEVGRFVGERGKPE
jgi:two-component system cell cycle response regulator DivK